jgi:uncharacterized membrane-anchored protein
MIRKNRLLMAAIVLALVQIGFLAWMIAGRAAILRDGQEVLLKVEPVDPRDLLRGDYVRLGYEISSIPAELVANADADTPVYGSIFVRLKQEADGFWRPVSATLGHPSATPPAQGEVEIRGTASAGWIAQENAIISVDYGMERFYLPEGEGKAIERDMRIRNFGILAAVGKGGAPQIKALMDGNTALFTEPLY